jgi:putative copper resistance protein D
VNDLHEGGAVMWIGGAAIMFAVIMVTFFQWTRETRTSASMGWLESARRTNMADRIAETNPAGTASAQSAERGASGTARSADVDEDEDQLAAYNDYLARINALGRSEPGPAPE